MRVEELMQKDVRVCRADDAMTEAARIMWEADCGSVPVISGQGRGELVGIITDRDVCMAAYTRGKPLTDLRVAEAMSKDVRTCGPGDELSAAAGAMRAAQIRRLPVVDASSQLLGIVSLSDIAREFSRQRARGGKAISAVEVGELLAGICEPRKLEAGDAKRPS
jgi:CBS domain-containing protein